MSLSVRRFALIAAVFAAPVLAQDGWARVVSLPMGTKISVSQRGASTNTGLIQAVTADVIRMNSGAQAITIAKGDTTKVVNLSRNHRLRNLLIGAGIGVIGGVILDKTANTRFTNEGSSYSGAFYGASIAIGAGIGALIPSHPVIYRSK
jgi:hypothetical protein